MHKWHEVLKHFLEKGPVGLGSLWDYATALRGSDMVNNDTKDHSRHGDKNRAIKNAFTSPLRGACIHVVANGHEYYEKPTAKILLGASLHYMIHIMNGWYALIDYFRDTNQYEHVKVANKIFDIVYELRYAIESRRAKRGLLERYDKAINEFYNL